MAHFPRSLNNKEKAMMTVIKEFGFAYELKFINSHSGGGGYHANIPILKETWCLSSPLPKKHRERVDAFLKEARNL